MMSAATRTRGVSGAGATKATLSSCSGGKLLYLNQCASFDALHYELGNLLPVLNGENVFRIEVNGDDLNLSTVVTVDQSWCVDE